MEEPKVAGQVVQEACRVVAVRVVCVPSVVQGSPVESRTVQ